MTDFERFLTDHIAAIETAKVTFSRAPLGNFSFVTQEIRAAKHAAQSWCSGRLDAFETALNIVRDPNAVTDAAAIIKMYLRPTVVASHSDPIRTAGQESAVTQILLELQ